MPSFTLSSPVGSDTEIKKSRFIGLVVPVASRDEALSIVAALRAEHRGAAHVCWALLAGGQSGMSDDGEPSGTAGRPMLDVLRHHDLDGVLAAVVRYYGGVKLGAGGLVRAYADAVASALKKAELAPRIAQATLTVDVDYAEEARIRHWIESSGHALLDSAHGTHARLTMRMPLADLEKAREQLLELTRGRCRFVERDD
ncbi:IMPACT family protein [Noviherbaspirillum galbum]|uniref:YigZ family protein n=1 Tax=Noviherbaspirillum galbum TaxID=2709383 RepID=A0A6B3SQR3_9BURK|nr:YigZ family protein [Noviherbaspirillum galbum]NEX63114.1 YigZ family protein [Noviherbaspirillum galbum]